MAKAVSAGSPTPRGSAMRPVRGLLARPEFTAVVGTVAVFLFFAIFTGSAGFLTAAMTRNYFEVAATIGIIAAPVTLLLVAGEFDLSVGATVAAGEITIGYLLVEAHWPLVAALVVAVLIALLIGFVNGFLVVKTKLPSFIITLAMLFFLRGTTQGVLRMLTGASTVDGVRTAAKGDALLPLFNSSVGPFSISLLWWIGVTVLAAWALERTRFGNWIYATGGNQPAAVRTGIPTGKVKIALYMATAVSAVIVSAINVFAINQGSAYSSTGREFETVVAAVIGGALLTGGYGSPIGTFFGALLFGMVDQGFFFTPLPDQWFQTFLGVMLLLAVLVNNYTRNRALKPARPHR